MKQPGEEERFLVARAGDHLMVPFQCETCHFRNIYQRDPVRMLSDEEALDFIRDANIDAFWGREESTVSSNLREGIRMEKTMKGLGMPSATPPMGPYPLEDVFGMKMAVAILDRSLDPGLYEENVQWDTFRRLRSAGTNISQAGCGGLSDRVGAFESNKLWISKVVTHQFWFGRFMLGVHKRVGTVRRPDKDFPIDVMHAIDAILEHEWLKCVGIGDQKRVAEMGAWFLGGFCTGLRGEEMPLIELAGTANSLKHLRDAESYFVFVISGRTKGNRLAGAKFGVPCVFITEGTHLRPGRWVERLVNVLHKSGRRGGRLFERRLKPTKLMEYEHDFFKVIEKVQSTTDLITDDVDVREAYGILRSLRRSVTAHARNMGVPKDLINAINRWRKEANSSTGAPRLDMDEVYAELDALIPLMLRYSRAL